MVTIYGSMTCFHCLRCKQMLESLEIEHEYLEVEDAEVGRAFRELFPEAEGIPQILWEGQHLGGYTELTHKIDEFILNNEGETP